MGQICLYVDKLSGYHNFGYSHNPKFKLHRVWSYLNQKNVTNVLAKVSRQLWVCIFNFSLELSLKLTSIPTKGKALQNNN